MDNKWRDRHSVLEPEDSDALDSAAATHEFRGGLTQDQAEGKAYEDYVKGKALDSAAHHYLGMRASLATNNQGAAKQHGAAFALAMEHLGFNPNSPLPKELSDRVKDLKTNPYSFKAHKADSFFEKSPEIPGHQEEPKNKTLELLERLKGLRADTSNNT